MDFIDWLVNLYTEHEPLINMILMIGTFSGLIGSIIAAFKEDDEKTKYKYAGLAFVCFILIAFSIFNISKWVHNYIENSTSKKTTTVTSATSNIETTTSTATTVTTATTATTTASLSISMPKIGEIKTFGTYEQGYDTLKKEGIKEDIEWIVLDVTDNKVLLLSKQLLAHKAFNNDLESTDWSSCTLNSWLNGSFINSAFSSSERSQIQYNSDAGAKVFLLSVSEADYYFSSNSSRIARLTEYAPIQYTIDYNDGVITADVEKRAKEHWKNGWWLRDSGSKVNRAALVKDNGSIITAGYDVTQYGVAVRPAIWVQW